MSKSHLSRRQFMNRSLAAAGVGAGFAIGGTKSSGRVLGANDTDPRRRRRAQRPRRRRTSASSRKMQGVEITYLVDPDTRTFEKRLEQIEQAGRPRAGDRSGHPPGARRQESSTPSRSPRPTTGTP